LIRVGAKICRIVDLKGELPIPAINLNPSYLVLLTHDESIE